MSYLIFLFKMLGGLVIFGVVGFLIYGILYNIAKGMSR